MSRPKPKKAEKTQKADKAAEKSKKVVLTFAFLAVFFTAALIYGRAYQWQDPIRCCVQPGWAAVCRGSYLLGHAGGFGALVLGGRLGPCFASHVYVFINLRK